MIATTGCHMENELVFCYTPEIKFTFAARTEVLMEGPGTGL